MFDHREGSVFSARGLQGKLVLLTWFLLGVGFDKLGSSVDREIPIIAWFEWHNGSHFTSRAWSGFGTLSPMLEEMFCG